MKTKNVTDKKRWKRRIKNRRKGRGRKNKVISKAVIEEEEEEDAISRKKGYWHSDNKDGNLVEKQSPCCFGFFIAKWDKRNP